MFGLWQGTRDCLHRGVALSAPQIMPPGKLLLDMLA